LLTEAAVETEEELTRHIREEVRPFILDFWADEIENNTRRIKENEKTDWGMFLLMFFLLIVFTA